MPLNKLDNFIKNTEGRILYVSPSDLDSTDSINNEGNSLARPFKTLQRALIESSRFSYVKGRSNDLIEKTTILLMPGDHSIDNRPGLAIYDATGNNAKTRLPGSSPTGSDPLATVDLNLNLESNFDLTQDDNVLYKFNSVDGGVVVPRGTSIVGLDLRKTKLRPKYVPNPTDPSVPSSAIFRITGGCYFWQFSIFDGNDIEEVYTSNIDNSLKATPIFSHHKLTVFEYCDGVNKVSSGDQNYDLTDLEMYYAKVGNGYNQGSGREIEGSEKYPTNPLAFEPVRPEYEIVGAFASDPLTIATGAEFPTTGIQAGTDSGVTSNVTVRTSKPHGYQVGTPIKIRGVTPTEYNISAIVSYVSDSDDTIFTYTLPNPPLGLPAGNASSATVSIETDTVDGASPYIFNCSLRSVYGMNGLKADGDKATGFKSMVVAQFTGVSLQKDDRAFAKYNTQSRVYESISIPDPAAQGGELAAGSSSIATGQAYHLDSEAVYRQGWETTHINIINDGILQIVSVFAIGYAKHFHAGTGSDASITNSNSNFGQLSLIADGFKKKAFDKDNKAYVTSIIPPRSIETLEESLDWVGIDVTKTASVNVNNQLYIAGYTSEDIKPPVITQGYRVGAKINDKLYVTKDNTTYEAPIAMPNYGTTSFKSYPVTSTPDASTNAFTVGTHLLETGEKVIVVSDNGDYPENIETDVVYYIIDKSNTTVELAISKANAVDGIPITVSGGTDLSIVSRVTDKTAGEIGHPVQYANNQWYVTTNHIAGGIFDNIANFDSDDISYIKRTEDTRSLDEKVYKVRVVIPRELGNAKNPEDGFILQESSSTGARSNSDFTLNSTLTRSDYEYDKNPSFISTCTESVTGIASVTTELPHNLNTGDVVNILNVTDSVNITGVANTGYNGYYSVTVVDDMRFTYAPTKAFGSNSTNNTSVRTTSLPRFERNDLQSNLYIYRNETISEYIDGIQDGIYHLYLLDASNKVPSEFNDYNYSQNVVNLYPQLDRDNLDANPASTKSYAVNSPLGKVVTNELKKSLTREAIDDFSQVLGIGVSISAVTGSNINVNPMITFSKRHGLSGIQDGELLGGGSGYINGTYYNVKLRNASVSGTWQGATAKVVVSGNAISSFEVQSPGAGYTATGVGGVSHLYFDQTHIKAASPSGTAAILKINPSGYANAVNDILQVTGIGTTSGGHYRITSVHNDTQISIAKTAGDPLISAGQYGMDIGPAIPLLNEQYNNGTSTINVETDAPNSHGLVAGNTFSIRDNNNNVLGPWTVKSVVDFNTFTSITNVNLTNLSQGYLIKHGYDANEKVSDKGDENIAARMTPVYAHNYTRLVAASGEGNTIQIYKGGSGANAGITTSKFPYGSYIQIDEEIMRIASPNATGGSNNVLTVIRGALATGIVNHVDKSLVKAIKPLPVEFRRPSILRASGHTFEYLGYGPGNYSTALPQVQNRTLNETEEFLVQSQEKAGGVVVYTGMNNKGDFYIGNQKKSSSTGEEITFDTPIPTVTGEDAATLSMVTDEITVKERIVVEGGDSGEVLSQFDGPVTFNKTIKINDDTRINGKLRITDPTESTNSTTGALTVVGGVGIGKDVNIDGGVETAGLVVSGVTTVSGTIKASADSSYDIGEDAVRFTNGYFDNIYGDGSQLTGVDVPGGNIGTCFYRGTTCEFGTATGTDTLKIYQGSGGHSYISHTNDTSGDHLIIQSANNIILESHTDNSNFLRCVQQGAVEIYHNTADGATKVLETTVDGTAKGVKITGFLDVTQDITAFWTSSDKNLKDNVSPITKALDKVKSLSGNTFNWNEKSRDEGKADVGVIAQEVEALGLPGIIQDKENGFKSVQYHKLVPVLIEAIKELSDKVDSLEQKLSDK